MTWRITTVEKERMNFINFVMASHEEATFIQKCEDYAISTKTGYKWLKRYHLHGLEGLKDLSRARKFQPSKISIDEEECIIEIRKKYRTWGPKKIRTLMEREYNNFKIPSESSIGNILKKNNLSKPRYYRRHVAKTAPLGSCLEPNEVWMYDFKGSFMTGDGNRCEPLTITDGFSRYLIRCEHMKRKRGSDVWCVLENAFKEYGLPKRIRSDNGPPFATTGIGRLSRLAIKLIKVGVTPEWIEPGHPEQNGRHERFHLTLKNETATPPALNLNIQTLKFEQFSKYYNFVRPHEALNLVTPSSQYLPSNRKWNGEFRSPEYSDEYEIRRVCKGGNISWRGKHFFLSECLYGEPIGINRIEQNIMGVNYGPILLGTIDLSRGFKRK